MSDLIGSCGVCNKDTNNVEGGLYLCYEHAAVARRVAKLKTAQTPFDLIGSRSHGERNSNDGIGGRRTTYDIVPEGDIERVSRDVQVEISDVPIWSVEALFQRLHAELGRPDITAASAKLVIRYEGLDDQDYARLTTLGNTLWADIEFEVVKTRIYPPQKLMAQKLAEVDREAAEAYNREKTADQGREEST